MPNAVCDPFGECVDLDGRLLLTRAAEGPAAFQDPGDLSVGDVSMHGVAIHPYVRLIYRQKWIPREACYGPVRSVIGLAPAETMTTETRVREQVDYATLVQDAVESASVHTHTEETTSSSLSAPADYGVTIPLLPLLGVRFGSIFEDIGSAIAGGAAAVAGFVGDVIDSLVGGDSPHSTTEEDVNTVLDVVETFERKQTITETSFSRSRLREQTISRTVTNPYRDRGLELRFVPVFRKFEVVTTLWRFDYGIVIKAGDLAFAERTVAARHSDFIQRRALDPRIAGIATAELGIGDDDRAGIRPGVVGDHLNANPKIYTGRYLSHLQESRDLDTLRELATGALTRPVKGADSLASLVPVLKWRDLHVTGRNIEVPMLDLREAVTPLKLRGQRVERLTSLIDQTIARPDWFRQFTWTRNLHLYIGTVVEPVAGTCVLDLPPPGRAQGHDHDEDGESHRGGGGDGDDDDNGE